MSVVGEGRRKGKRREGGRERERDKEGEGKVGESVKIRVVPYKR